MKFTIVRHGQTDWNKEKKGQGQTDIPLNDKGRLQAQELAEKLKDEIFDLVIVSPLSRARETAEIVCKGRHIPFIIDEESNERNLGDLEGQNSETEIFNEIRFYHKNISVPHGEDCKTYTARVFKCLEKWMKAYGGQYHNILVVNHGFFMRSAKWFFMGFPNQPEEVERFVNGQVDSYII